MGNTNTNANANTNNHHKLRCSSKRENQERHDCLRCDQQQRATGFCVFPVSEGPPVLSSDNIHWNAVAGGASLEQELPDSSERMQAEESEKVTRGGGVTRTNEQTKGWMNEETKKSPHSNDN